jgi:hypothetical protein
VSSFRSCIVSVVSTIDAQPNSSGAHSPFSPAAARAAQRHDHRHQADPLIPLRGGSQIPQLGFGVFQVPPEQTEEVVATALEAGYRHLDTAAAYRNEATVGQAIRASGLSRGEVFVTTKCFNDDQGHEEARRAFHASLERLEMDYVDLYLIPLAGPGPRPLRGDLEGVHRASRRGSDPCDRRVQLPARRP